MIQVWPPVNTAFAMVKFRGFNWDRKQLSIVESLHPISHVPARSG